MKTHMALPANNLQEIIQFYSILFGEGPVKIKEDYVKFDPKTVALNISFHRTDKSKKNDAFNQSDHHLGFELKHQKQLNALYDQFKKAGLSPQNRQESICCYAHQDKFWLTDPSGFQWEFYTLLEDTSEKISENSNCCKEESNEQKSNCC